MPRPPFSFPPVLQYMQFMEDYSEPQPSVFYQMPQSESIYEQRNKRFQEVYGFNDSFSSTDSVHEPLQPPALPPKQRQLVRDERIKRSEPVPPPPGQVFFHKKMRAFETPYFKYINADCSKGCVVPSSLSYWVLVRERPEVVRVRYGGNPYQCPALLSFLSSTPPQYRPLPLSSLSTVTTAELCVFGC